ncbi:MAG: response regulator transcription factor [Caulobacteraceae bacterium]
MSRILTIEDDELTGEEIEHALRARGFQVDRALDGAQGLRLASSGRYDAITLDRMLPGIDGLTIATNLKAGGVTTPILMISALSDVDERVRGLRAGGDDYLTKPFAPSEMVARIEVLMRRRRPEPDNLVLRFADVELDLVSQTARRARKDLNLARKEIKLLEMFIRHSEQALTRSMIFETVWGYNFPPGSNLIDVHVKGLRRKLDIVGLPPLILTIKGVGYMLSVEA